MTASCNVTMDYCLSQEEVGAQFPSSFGTQTSCPRANLVCSSVSSVNGSSPGTDSGGWCPLGFPGSPAWAGFKDSSCNLHLLSSDTGRGGTGGTHPQVQPSEPPEEERDGSPLWTKIGEKSSWGG